MIISRINAAIILFILILCPAVLFGQGESKTIVPDKWLLFGPMDAPTPSFCEDDASANERSALSESFINMKSVWPCKGLSSQWSTGDTIEWKVVNGGDLAPKYENSVNVAYFAGFLKTDRRQKVDAFIYSSCPVSLYINGAKKSGSSTRNSKGAIEIKTEADLVTGKHCFCVKAVFHPSLTKNPPRLSMKITPAFADTVEWSVEPARTFARIDHLNTLDRVSAAAISPDGEMLAIQQTTKKPVSATWIDLVNIESKKSMTSLRSANTPVWSPSGDLLAFRSGSSILTWNKEDNSIRTVLSKESGLSSFFFAPDSDSIYFTTHGRKPAPGAYTRLYDPRDRLTDWDMTSKLQVITLDGSSRRILTKTGEYAFTNGAVSPDGEKLALVRRLPIVERPYFETEFWIMDLKSGDGKCIKKARFFFENGPSNLTWSPDSKKIALKAPPGLTDLPGLGNEYNAFHSCLWILDAESGSLTPLTDRFGDSVESRFVWRAQDNMIYFLAQYRTVQRLVRIDPEGDGGLDVLTKTPRVVTSFSIASGKNKAAIIGSSINHPASLYLLNTDDAKVSLFSDPNIENMKNVKMGSFERFDFTNNNDYPVDGWILYPPDFDKSLKYPMIVYFYGGTTARLERFSASSYHWLTANGYIVYVVNPTGYAGYTHEFSSKHCNDWGKLAGRDIIEGTGKVLETKKFIDPKRVGCYGGSYGGFMALHLTTECDLFKTACSMYGISNLASYWGAGIWGYTYGDTAMASSYPWNNKDLFVGQSPLYKADKISASILLLHGDSDNNVPHSESEQMFTALKVLGKDVAYVRFAGEGHGISSKFSNFAAHRSMMLEWFDKHLKDQPEGWKLRWKK